MLKITSFILLFLLIIAGRKGSAQASSNYVVIKDSSVIVSAVWLLENVKPSDLSNGEIKELNKIFKTCIRANKKELRAPQKYKRQYIPVINSKGEKEIWVNCFCGGWNALNMDNKREVLSVMDGGNCYFNFKVNLKTKKWYNFMVNGAA